MGTQNMWPYEISEYAEESFRLFIERVERMNATPLSPAQRAAYRRGWFGR